jgi:hypothetical protein
MAIFHSLKKVVCEYQFNDQVKLFLLSFPLILVLPVFLKAMLPLYLFLYNIILFLASWCQILPFARKVQPT